MRTDELQTLKALILATAAYYGQKIEDQVLVMYAKDLEDLEFDAVSFAYDKWRKDPKHAKAPLPAQIRSMLNATVTDEDKARDAASRIVSAMSRFGYMRPEDAKEYVGELGWAVVERQGGWSSLCERVMREELPTYQAQWRQLALSLIHLFESGLGHRPPELPDANPKMLTKNLLSSRGEDV